MRFVLLFCVFLIPALTLLPGCCGWDPCYDECVLPLPEEDPCKKPDPTPCKPMSREPRACPPPCCN